MPHLSLALLGGFAVALDGAPLTAFGTDKVRALLAYLSVESNRPHQRAALAGLLWPDTPPPRASHNLRQSVLRLRRALGEGQAAQALAQPLLLLAGQTLQLNPLAGCQIDVVRFSELLAACRQHAHAHADGCRVCMGWLAQAVELYRGNFLAGFSLRDGLPFEEWQLLQQESLHRQAVEALERLATYHARRAEHELAQRYAARLVALDPWHEAGQLQLMHVLASTGQAAAATEQYMRYRESLEREFGMQPPAEATALVKQIQARQIDGAAPALGRASPPAPRASAPSQPAELRRITALVCSWRDTGASDDPEDLHQLLESLEQRLQQLLERYGGYRQQRQGDEWLIYFGYPQAYEDAARRAIHVGLALAAATRGMHAPCIGIHTGVMVVSGATREPVGDVPSQARACLALAEPGSVLITGATELLVRGWFDYRRLRLPASAAPRTSQIYRVVGESQARSPLDWLAQLRNLTLFVGRDHELGRLITTLDAASQGAGAIVAVSGEPGIGKSRLLWELRQACPPPVDWLESRCSPYFQNTHLHPIIGLIEQLLGFAPGDSQKTRRARLTQVLARYSLAQPGSAWLLALLLGLPTDAPSPEVVSPQLRERMRELLIALIQRRAAERPIVLALEDLHWADPSTLEWLGASLDALAAGRCLLLLTYRPSFTPPWPPRARLRPIALGPLSSIAIERLVADLAGAYQLPSAAYWRIVAQSDGIPLFAEELTKALLEAEEGADYDHVPDTLSDSLLARLERVGPARETAGWAAALGREFGYPLLAAAVPYAEPRLQADLAALVDADLLVVQRSALEPRYAFKHALIQEAAHAALLKRARQDYHRRIAEVYLARFPQLAEAQPEILAQHYSQADLPAQAADQWLRAGERATVQGALVEAQTFFDRALALVAPDDHERRWRTLVGRERVLDIRSARAEQADALARLLALADMLNDDARRAYAYLRQTALAGVSGKYQDTLPLATAAAAAARRAGNLPIELHALAYQAQTLTFFQDMQVARQVVDTLLAQVDQIDDRTVRAQILTVSAHYYLDSGDLSRAVQLQRGSAEAAQQAGSYELVLVIEANLSIIYAVLGLYAEAQAVLERVIEQSDLFGVLRVKASAQRHLGFVSWCRGDFQAARQQLNQALELLVASGDTYGQSACHWNLGLLLEDLGELELAARHLGRARTGFAAINLAYDRFEPQAAEARVVQALGHHDQACQLALEVWRYLQKMGHGEITDIAQLCLCLADVAAALPAMGVAPHEVLELGYRDIVQRAEQISDPTWRRSFLENVRANRALLERWSALH